MVTKEEVEAFIGEDVDHIGETHMSLLYFGHTKVAKYFKPVDLGFTNLCSVEARRTAAIKTAEIDSAYCPDLGSVAVEIAGNPFIVMRKFDSSKGLDRLYETGEVTKEHGRQIGIMFARAHKKAKTDEEISGIAYASISKNWEELFIVSRDFAKAIGKTISEESYREIISNIRAFIARNDSYFQARRDGGKMRQCHGDGHSGNMFVENDQVKVFDGIGFKNEFSYMDPISDVAFAIMDAIVRGREDIAKEIIDSYTVESNDIEGIEKLLSFYVCYRAFVRGQINTMIGNGLVGAEQENVYEAARKYYALAVKYCPE